MLARDLRELLDAEPCKPRPRDAELYAAFSLTLRVR